MDEIFVRLDAWLLAVLLALAMVTLWRIGWRMGRRLRDRHGESPESKWDDAALALLGLLLAFSFGVSISKHDQRKLMVVADSNAIGDFYTCASLLKEPVRTKLRDVIREYTRSRLDLTRQPLDEAGLQRALQRFDEMHAQMTDLVAEAVSAGTPIAVSLTNTLNQLTSNQAARLAAFRDRLPSSVVFLLFASSIVAAFLVGREQGASKQAQLVHTMSFILLVSLTVYVILDLIQPERGQITINQEPMRRLLSSMSR